MTITPRYVGDDLVIRINIKDDAGAVKLLAGGTAVATAARNDVLIAPTSVDVTNIGTTGQVVLTWAGAAFVMGIWNILCRVTYLSEDQMVFDETSEWRESPL